MELFFSVICPPLQLLCVIKFPGLKAKIIEIVKWSDAQNPIMWIFKMYQTNRVSDTTASQARHGKDIQGIPWDQLQFSREKYRETRLQQYENYRNLLQSQDDMEMVHILFSLGLRSLNLEGFYFEFGCGVVQLAWAFVCC
jgi:hypothetical protein